MLIRDIIDWWQRRTRRRALHRAIPILRELDRQDEERRRQHRGGALRIQKARRQAVTLALAGGKPRVRVKARREP